MVSSEHEVPLDLIREDPSLLLGFLDEFDVKVPAGSTLLLDDPTLNTLKVAEHCADQVVLFRRDGRDLLAVVVESQLRWKEEKVYDWFPYIANIWGRRKCPAVLLVIAPDEQTARRCRTPIFIGHPGLILTPLVIGPSNIPVITDLEVAAEHPHLTVLSAAAHGGSPYGPRVLRAFAEARQHIPDEAAADVYTEFVASTLPDATIKLLEDLLNTTKPFPRHLPSTKKAFAEGEAKGRAQFVLLLLERHGIAVPEAERDRILSCEDAEQLVTWADRIHEIASIEELFAE